MKIKILSTNRTQQINAVSKARSFGAEARDGDYGPVKGKTAIVINTLLGAGTPAIQLSSLDYTPTKKPYDQTISYKDFMNMDVCPWDNGKKVTNTDADVRLSVKPTVITETIIVPVKVKVGVCAQDTLKVKNCKVLVQETIGFKTLGLPSLTDAGVDVTMDDDKAYIIDSVKNDAEELTAELAAKNAQRDILAGESTIWSDYACNFDLVSECVLEKRLDDADADAETDLD